VEALRAIAGPVRREFPAGDELLLPGLYLHTPF